MSWPVLPLGLLGSQASTSDNDTYQVSRSLRFNSLDSAYLSRTPSVAGNRKTWTFSAWVKRSTIGSAESNYILGNAQAPTGTNGVYLGFSSDTLLFGDYGASTWDWYVLSSSVYRDISAWYHIVAQYDSTQATSTERIKLYVNGARITAFSAATYPTLNVDGRINQASVETAIGRLGTVTSSGYFGGYMAEVNFIDGQALTPSSFGETDATTGRWKAKTFTGTYGTNGFYLNFLNNSSTTTRNLLTYSEDFANGAWSNYQSTETSNVAVAPNGTTTADKLIPDAGALGGQFYRNFSAIDNTTYTLSIYAKAAEYTQLRLYIQRKATSATFDFADYDLTSATVTATYGSPTSTSIVSVGNGWYRVSISANVGTGGTATPGVNIQHIGSAGNGSNGILLWGAQLEDSGTLGPYFRTDASATASTLRLGSDSSVSAGGYNSFFANNLSVTPGTGNDSLADSPTNFGSISTTLVDDTYQISKSLRFNSLDSAYLSRTPSVAGNRKTWTWSGWVKRAKVSTGTYYQLFGGGTGSGANDGIFFDTTAGGIYYTATGSDTLVTSSVYRDTSAWYHIVLASDTAQPTSTNRIRIYVNGSEVTSFATANYPAQNADNIHINTTSQHRIGAHTNAGFYFDGYLAEVNFVDGQALTPSSFGTRDINTYLWKPKAYTGTYGTNGFYLNFSDSSNTTATTLGKDQAGSNNWTPSGTPGFSVGSGVGNDSLVDSPTYYGTDTGVGGEARGDYATLNPLVSAHTYSNGNLDVALSTTGITSISSAVNSLGVSSGKWYFEFTPTVLNTGCLIGITATPTLNVYPGGNSSSYGYYSVDGSKFNNASGTAYGNSFTVNDIIGIAFDIDSGKIWFAKNGTWQASGNPSAGTNAAFTSIASGTYFASMHKDTAGAANASATFNFGQRPFAYTAPSGFKALRDYNKLPVPTGGEVRGNYATLNPLDAVAVTSTTNGNLDVSLSASGSANIRSTIAVSSGKWYWEVLFGSTGDTLIVGACDATVSNASSLWSTANAWMYYSLNGQKYNGGGTSYGATFTNGDLIGIALDMDNGTISFYKNGVSQGQAYSGLIGRTLTPTIQSTVRALTATANFGQRPWAYDAPFGFLPLCTTLLPQPIIQKSSTAMDVVTYTGNGATSQDITGLSFSPDLIWLKSRTDAYDHRLKDTIRGNFALFSNLTNAESGYSLDFLSNGIRPTLGFNDNISSKQYVAWAWDAGSSNATNTSGSITSTVRANPQAGVSIVSFVNASGTNQSTVGHGLGSSPKMIIAKNRDTSANNWAVFHSSVCDTTSKFLQLNTTSALTTFATVWGASLPSSSVFGVTGGGIAAASVNMIAYCFAEIEGFSKFGSYTGNGSADGPFVYCGFRPRWVLVKRTDNAFENWQIQDSVRSVSNPAQNNLFADLSLAELIGGADRNYDFVSNGFKLRGNNTGTNGSGGTYIFAAFAESPFKYSRAR